jgi:plasmid stabilization system protein ParE
MNRFVLTPRAKQDLNDIWDYIADDNIEAADQVLEALESAMLKLARILASVIGVKISPTSGTDSFWCVHI